MRNKGVAALLAFFLGGIGVHKFYLGQLGQGMLYLLFCWTLIPAFIAFIEVFVYLSMSDRTFDLRYNADEAHHLAHQAVTRASPANVADEIHKLDALRRSGAITEAEFEAQKRRLLG